MPIVAHVLSDYAYPEHYVFTTLASSVTVDIPPACQNVPIPLSFEQKTRVEIMIGWRNS